MKRKIERYGIVETNSSSSHSICICTEDKDLRWDFKKDGNKIIIPNPSVFFGRELYKTNSCEVKAQYAFGLALARDPYKQYLIIEAIKEVTGVDEVICEWVEELKKEIRKGIRPSYLYVSTPEVDHESADLFYEVFESKETLINFIFNPRSWLICNDDSYSFEELKDIYSVMMKSNESHKVIIKIHLGKNIGDIEFEKDLLVFNSPFYDDITDDPWDIDQENLITDLIFNEETDLFYYRSTDIVVSKVELKDPEYRSNRVTINRETGEYLLEMCSNDKDKKLYFNIEVISKIYGKIL